MVAGWSGSATYCCSEESFGLAPALLGSPHPALASAALNRSAIIAAKSAMLRTVLIFQERYREMAFIVRLLVVAFSNLLALKPTKGLSSWHNFAERKDERQCTSHHFGLNFGSPNK